MKRLNKFGLYNSLFFFFIIYALVLLQQNFPDRNNLREDTFVLAHSSRGSRSSLLWQGTQHSATQFMAVGTCGTSVHLMADEEKKKVSLEPLAELFPSALHDLFLPTWPYLPNIPQLPNKKTGVQNMNFQGVIQD